METYAEETLDKVYNALYAAGLDHSTAEDAVNSMQNAGILFRERSDKPGRGEEVENCPTHQEHNTTP